MNRRTRPSRDTFQPGDWVYYWVHILGATTDIRPTGKVHHTAHVWTGHENHDDEYASDVWSLVAPPLTDVQKEFVRKGKIE